MAPFLDPLPETCTLLRVYSPKVKDGFYASQHPSIPASGFAGLGWTAFSWKDTL
jgi:hypothetical protein